MWGQCADDGWPPAGRRPLPYCCCHHQLPAAAAAAAVPGRHPPGGDGEVQSRVWTKNWLPEAALACASPGPGAGWAGQRRPVWGAARAHSGLGRTQRHFSSCEGGLGAESVQRSGKRKGDFESVGEAGEKELEKGIWGAGGRKEGEDGIKQLRKILWAPKTLPEPDTNHPLTTDCIHVSLLHFWLLYDFVDYDRRRSVTLVLLRLHALISDSFVIFSNI